MDNADIWRQHGVQRVAELVAGDAAFGVEVHGLAQRVHACVGAAGPVNDDAFPGQPRQFFLNDLLNDGIITQADYDALIEAINK